MPTKRNANAGYSLVELMIIVAIMGVLIGLSAITINVVKNANVEKSSKTINNMLTVCRERAMTMAAKEWVVRIEEKKVDIIKVTSDGNREITQSAELPKSIKVYLTEDNIIQYMSEDSPIEIAFAQFSGEILDVRTDEKGSIKTSNKCAIASKYKSKVSKVILYYSTGKHSVDK